MNNLKDWIINSIGIVTAIAGFLALPETYRTEGYVAFVIILLIILFRLIQARRTHIGEIDDPPYVIRIAETRDLGKIAKLQKKFYGKDAVPFEIYQSWHQANGRGFYVFIKENEKELIGHLTFLAIKQNALDRYKEGAIVETEIRGTDIIPSNRNSEMNHIYIESLIIEPEDRRNFLPELVRLLPDMIKSFCEGKLEHIKDVYAMAATSNGTDVLKNNGFQLVKRGRLVRKDKHEMYVSSFRDFYSAIEIKADRFNPHLPKKY